MTKKQDRSVEEPHELKDDEIEVIEEGEPENVEKSGAKESFEESKERPNKK